MTPTTSPTSALISRTFIMPGEDFDYEVPIVFREDGYINMTKAAKAFGKRDARHFFDNKETADYLWSLEAMTGIPGNALVTARRGGAKGQAGTWCHPKLAVFFARWLDVRFAVWCDLTIDNILRGNLEVALAEKAEGNPEAEALAASVAAVTAKWEAAEARCKALEEEREGL